MMKRETFAIATIYVPVKRRATLDPKKAQEIAESILQVGLQSPILEVVDFDCALALNGDCLELFWLDLDVLHFAHFIALDDVG
jgi:hypothetical protein